MFTLTTVVQLKVLDMFQRRLKQCAFASASEILKEARHFLSDYQLRDVTTVLIYRDNPDCSLNYYGALDRGRDGFLNAVTEQKPGMRTAF